VEGVFEFWADPDLVKGIKVSQEYLIRTNGGFLIKFIQDKALSMGTDKDDPLMNKVGQVMSGFQEEDVLAHEKLEGCNDDEWSE